MNDNQAPVITCAPNLTVNNDAGICGANVTCAMPTATDNCGVASIVSSHPATLYALGATVVTYTATDVHGLTSTCTRTITVVDNTKPVVTCKNITVPLSTTGTATISATQLVNTSSDNCSIASYTASMTSFTCSNKGNNNVTLTATDASGNVSTACTSVVTITDVTAPVIVCKNITVALSSTGTATITAAQVTNSATDNCSIASSTISKSTFTCSDKGNNNVTLTVKDGSGNTSTCVAVVTVIDNLAPIANCKNITVTLAGSNKNSNTNGCHGNDDNDGDSDDDDCNAPNSGGVTITAAQVNNGSTDNCGIVSMTVSPNTFSCANIGNNTVTLTLKDASGNVSTCTSTVTVVGTLPTCTITPTVPSHGSYGGCGTSYAYTGGNAANIYLGYGPQAVKLVANAIGATGNVCYKWTAAPGLSCTDCKAPVFTPTSAGSYNFTCTITNQFGCSSTCSVVICVKDIRVPNQAGKVYLCHAPDGNPANNQTLSISTSAVPAHLSGHSRDKLGSCGQMCPAAKSALVSTNSSNGNDNMPELISSGSFNMAVYPNPTLNSFHLKLESDSPDDINLEVYDMSGRVVYFILKAEVNKDLEYGADLRNGMYIQKVTQGESVKYIKLVKQTN